MRKLRVIDDGVAPACRHTAVSQVLLHDHATATPVDCLRFYRFEPCVLLGHGQPVATSCNFRYCRSHGIDIARRITGGGAVYMSPAMLAWDVVIPGSRNHTTLSETVGRAVASAMASLRVPAEFRPPNDLVLAGAKISGAKISGAATTSFGKAFLIQGTLLLSDETAAMSAALDIPLTALRAAVTSLNQSATRPIETPSLQQSIAESLAAAFELTPIASALTATEVETADRLQSEFEVEFPSGAAP